MYPVVHHPMLHIFFQVSQTKKFLRGRYWRASRRCSFFMSLDSARSAMVRASFITRWYARAERSSFLAASLSKVSISLESVANSSKSFGPISEFRENFLFLNLFFWISREASTLFLISTLSGLNLPLIFSGSK